MNLYTCTQLPSAHRPISAGNLVSQTPRKGRRTCHREARKTARSQPRTRSAQWPSSGGIELH